MDELKQLSFLFWDQFGLRNPTEVEINNVPVEENEKVLEIFPCLKYLDRIKVVRDPTTLKLTGALYFDHPEEGRGKYETSGRVPLHKIILESNLTDVEIEFYCTQFSETFDFVHSEITIQMEIEITRISSLVTRRLLYKRYYFINFPKGMKGYLRHNLNINIRSDITTKYEDQETIFQSGHVINTRCDSFEIKEKKINLICCPEEISLFEDALIIETEDTEWDDDYVRFIEDYVSLMIGRHLILVGEKGFDNHGPASFQSLSPILYRFKMQGSFFQIGYSHNYPLTAALSDHINEYYNNYRTMKLHLPFNYFSDAKTQCLEIGLVQFQQTVETLVNCFFGDDGDQKLITREEMNERYGDLLDEFRNRLELYGDPKAICDGIERSFLQSSTKRYEEFNRRLGIIVTNKEEDMIGRAHKIRHGGTVAFDKMTEIRHFYERYCCTAFLKLAGIDMECKGNLIRIIK